MSCKFIRIAFGLGFLVCLSVIESSYAVAGNAAPSNGTVAAPAAASAPPPKKSEGADDKSLNSWTGGAWAGGLAILADGEKLYPKASLVGPAKHQLIRADTTESYHPEVLFTYHWYFSHQDGSGKGQCTTFVTNIGACGGLFLGFGLGGTQTSTQAVDTAVGGLMLGWGGSTDDVQNQKFNIGFAWGHRYGVSTLGDGLFINQPLPKGETQIRYTTKDIIVRGLFFTYTWGDTKK